MTPDQYPSVTVVAGPVQRHDGLTSTMLRMHDGAIYIHLDQKTAAQWLPVITSIANEGINE